MNREPLNREPHDREPLNREPHDREPLNREPHDREPLNPEPHIPIIAMTAGAMQQERERCFEAGMDDFVAKPVNPGELARVLGRWLGTDRSQESGVRSQEGEEGGERKAKERTEEGAALPVFDRVALLDRCMDEEDLVRDVLTLFLDNMPERIQELQAALDTGDVPAAHLVAHTIKGMAANIGAEVLRALAREMEDAAEGGELEAVRARMGVLVERFEELRKVVV